MTEEIIVVKTKKEAAKRVRERIASLPEVDSVVDLDLDEKEPKVESVSVPQLLLD